MRVPSVDVLEDKKIRINLVVVNTSASRSSGFGLDHLNGIQLVSDSLDRVSSPKVQGLSQWTPLAPQDGIKFSLTFPAFPEETKRINLIFQTGSTADSGGSMPAFQIRGIPLFSK